MINQKGTMLNAQFNTSRHYP